VKSAGKKEIVVPPGAILATKGPQQQERQNDHFDQPAPVRAAHVQTAASRATPQKIESSV
jgi:hypothetical protein